MVAIVAGALVRLWTWSQRGSLWLDEASLALNIVGRDFWSLTGPLDWGQAAPIGFLLLTKVLVLLLHGFEGVLRLWPFVAGILTPAMVWIVGRRLAGDVAALFATVAVAFSLMAIRYSSEAKPYAPDACIALALVWLTTEVLERPGDSRRWWRLGVGGALAVVFSLPAVFVLAAVGLALAAAATRTGRPGRRMLAALGVCAGIWLITFGLLWVAGVGEAAGGSYLREYWAPVMLDPMSADFGARLGRILASVAATPLLWPGDLPFALGAVAVAICGVVSLMRRDAVAAVLLAGPTAFGALASVAGLYPMSDRLAFFAAPLILIASAQCIAGFVDAATQRARTGARYAGIAGAVLAIAALTAGDAWRMLRDPGALEQTTKLFLRVYGTAKRDATPVYIYARAAPAWLYVTGFRSEDPARFEFYRRTTGQTSHPAHENFAREGPVAPHAGDSLEFRGSNLTELVGLASGVRYRITGPMSRGEPAPGWATEEARRIRDAATPAVWIVASHFFEGTARDELRPLVQAMTAVGLQIVEEQRGGRDAVALRVEASLAPR